MSWTDVLDGGQQWAVHHADCLDVMREMPADCVHAIITDAPYGLGKPPDPVELLRAWLDGDELNSGPGIMGRKWDYVPGPRYWRECLRILKPGGHMLTFSGTRTEDLIGVALRLAGFERRDTLAWIHSEGMAKSVNMERMVAMHQCEQDGRHYASTLPRGEKARDGDHLCPATEESRRWDGHGSALGPSHEPIIVCRKPLIGTYAANAMAHGTSLNIDATRIAHADAADFEKHKSGVEAIRARGGEMDGSWKNASDLSGANEVKAGGRCPKNVLLEHDQACQLVGTEHVAANPTWDTPNRDTAHSAFTGSTVSQVRHEESVGVYECVDGCPVKDLEASVAGRARYFQQFRYQPKPARSEKDAGLLHFAPRPGGKGAKNVHPTCKSVELVRWLTRLVATPGQVVFNPFAGGGSEGVAAVMEGCRWIGCEIRDTDDEPFASIARARLTHLSGESYMPRESIRAEDSDGQEVLF